MSVCDVHCVKVSKDVSFSFQCECLTFSQKGKSSSMESASGEGKLTLREVASYAGTDTGKAVHALSIAVSNPL